MAAIDHQVHISVDDLALDATLALPRDGALGLVIFADGVRGHRLGPRDRHVAERLNDAGLATLLSDALTVHESAHEDLVLRRRLDVGLLARRLRAAIDWAHDDPLTRDLELGLFGASAGASAALIVAADRRSRVRSVVSCGGRLDVASDALERVHAPTLLIVGSLDHEALEAHRQAARRIPADSLDLLVVEGASHLFEEPGKLDEAATAAAGWFEVNLGRAEALPAATVRRAEPSRVRGLMTRDVVTCSSQDSLSLAARLLWDHDIGALPVIDGAHRVVGMLTDRDMCMAAYTQGLPLHEIRVADVMARRVHACREDDRPLQVLRTMAEIQVRRMPVLDDRGRLSGIVSINDLARAAMLLEEAEISMDVALEAIVAASRPRRRPTVTVGAAP